jgi:hypothetical protein
MVRTSKSSFNNCKNAVTTSKQFNLLAEVIKFNKLSVWLDLTKQRNVSVELRDYEYMITQFIFHTQK